MSCFNRISARVLSVTLLIASLVGCGALLNAPAGITMHTWRQVTWNPTDAWRGPTSAMYTYVLVGDGAEKGGTVDADRAQGALKRLLQLIEQTQAVSNSDPAFAHPIAVRMNQFCVPSKQGITPGASVGLAQYDFNLAQTYRQWFQVVTAKDPRLNGALVGTGPYLVATRTPLATLVSEALGHRAVVAESPVLVMDMSGRSDTTVAYYVEAFKAAVANAQPDSMMLRPMKPVIVKYLNDVNQGIPILEEFWSKSRRIFDQEQKA